MTSRIDFKISNFGISIPIPTRGMTSKPTKTTNKPQPFQSPFLREEWQWYVERKKCRKENFNPHSYERNDDEKLKAQQGKKRFQSPFLREEWRPKAIIKKRWFYISIPIPTRGMTQDKIKQKKELEAISIPIPTRGMTIQPAMRSLLPFYFNPHSYERNDL